MLLQHLSLQLLNGHSFGIDEDVYEGIWTAHVARRVRLRYLFVCGQNDLRVDRLRSEVDGWAAIVLFSEHSERIKYHQTGDHSVRSRYGWDNVT
ncbi:unnamed protein product, partial [Callosobruchus maculatus]